MSHWSDSRPLASATLLIVSSHGAPLRYPVVALCHGDPVALFLNIQPIHMLQQYIEEVGVVWVTLSS